MTLLRIFTAILFVAVSVFIIPGQAAAQQVGAKAGLNLATLELLNLSPADQAEIDREGDQRWRPGFSGGLFYVQPIARQIGLQVEGLLSVKGGRFEGKDFNEGILIDTRLIYLEIPILARIEVTPSSRAPAYLFTGPAMGVRLHGRETGDNRPQELGDEYLKRGDVGWTVGVGIDIGPMILDARFTQGLIDIGKGEFPEARNRAVTVMLGVGIGNARK